MSALAKLKNKDGYTAIEWAIVELSNQDSVLGLNCSSWYEEAAAELLAIRAELTDAKERAKLAEARLGKLQIVADSLAEIVEYDTGDARHGLQSLAKARLAEYETLKGSA